MLSFKEAGDRKTGKERGDEKKGGADTNQKGMKNAVAT
jgi:hypothetical protein